MEKKDILCPDCEQNYISQKRYTEYGKCISCYRREITMKSKGLQYVKYVDLSSDEKARITKQREIKGSSAKRIRNAKKDVNKKELNNNQLKEVLNDKTETTRRDKIYTPEIIQQIKLIASENILPIELLEMVKSLYPDKHITPSNLNNIISRYNIPHSSKRGRNARQEVMKNRQLDERLYIEDDVESIDNIEPKQDEILSDNIIYEDTEIENNTNMTSTNNLDDKLDLDDRFGPVRAEVNQVVSTRFKNLGCSLDRDYYTDDYIDMLEKLLYLKENSANIIRNRRSQQNIMNAYQSDMIHEFENVVAESGSTYLSDKMHTIRQYRRHYENDYKDVATLRPLLESLDVSIIKKVLEALKRNKTTIDNPIFMPLVDTTLVDKYDWAKPLNSNSYKSRVSVVNYNPNNFNRNLSNNGRPLTRIGLPPKTPPTEQLNSKMRKKLKIFRVSCKVSGGGYGVMSNWYRDYECTNSKTALEYATNTLNKLASTRKGMYWTDLDVVELNVGPVKNELEQVNTSPVTKDTYEFNATKVLDENATKQFQITCQVSGGGIGVFKNWTRTYKCNTEIEAKKAADVDMNQLKNLYNGILVTQLNCKEV